MANFPQSTRPEERFAFAVMGRTLGVVIICNDDGSQPAMVDGHFSLLDGRAGAVEVTTAADQTAMQSEREISKRRLSIPELEWSWHVNIGPGVNLDELDRHLSQLLPECERQGVADPDSLLPTPGLTESYVWLHAHDVHIGASPTTNHPGRIYLVPGTGDGGMVPHDLDGFPAWLREQLDTPRFASDLAKLRTSGRSEQHLFLRIHEMWMPFKFDALVAWSEVLPIEPFDPPEGLTGIWLATRWKNPILWWSRDTGWRRTNEFD